MGARWPMVCLCSTCDPCEGNTFYQVSNTDNRISNPDQLLTQDVERFTASVVELYSNVSKPILDMCVYTYKLSHTIGLQGPGNRDSSGMCLACLLLSLPLFRCCQRNLCALLSQERCWATSQCLVLFSRGSGARSAASLFPNSRLKANIDTSIPG